jgi:hypothetical protein
MAVKRGTKVLQKESVRVAVASGNLKICCFVYNRTFSLGEYIYYDPSMHFMLS